MVVMVYPYLVVEAYYSPGAVRVQGPRDNFLKDVYIENLRYGPYHMVVSYDMEIVENSVLQYKNYAQIFAASNISRKIKPQRFFQAQHFEEIHKYS